MVKKILLLSFILTTMFSFAQVAITKVYSDFGGYWESGTSIKPNNDHNLLAFTWNQSTYSTGINDVLLGTKGVSFNPTSFRAFSTFLSQTVLSNNTFIGVGEAFGGLGNVTPVPVQNNLTKYLIDGPNGLDLGTGIFNFPKSGQVSFEIVSIDANSINDGVPDVVITQIGDPGNSSSLDEYYFVDANNNIVGNKYIVNFGTVKSVGVANWKFYNANVDPPTYNTGVSSSPGRDLRLLAFDWSELGLTKQNQSQVVKLVQVFSGDSDTAFTAYNSRSINIKQSITGVVFNDNNAGTPDGNGYANATLSLKNSVGSVIKTTTTGANGNYAFTNVSSGIYTIELTTPSGFVIVGNADVNTTNVLRTVVADTPITERNFGINQQPVAKDDVYTTQFNTILSSNILANDLDPNSGVLIPASINLTAPSGATNLIITNGLLKGFTIAAQGKWFVDNTGILTFTPTAGFIGNPTSVQYIVKDNANLTSNIATIFIKVEEFCYKPAATGGTSLDTTQGITSLGRAGAAQDNWPMVRKGAWTAMESKTKGFVVNRIAKTATVNAIPNPIEGMLVYDQEAKCLKIYTTVDNGATFSWKCMNKQACP
ncbi:SdrD B-like domain-containing protein [Halpernia frigidisoli]|uniref:Cna protein B-type domain-containing protein n=1 Tax=Halpernia frigidisoli TaxID=1125876 RepID=A0A1I3FNE5_9FLAO|nr:SdrD B-like domain-containing protein [Halpernia frigidisoli]SFI12647.1 Cna protein B-type domain-containing protein [Halpernia frigidisoli]